MKFKLAIAMAAAMFTATLTIGSAKADEFNECFSACVYQYQACIRATPDKEALCRAYDRQCKAACGAFN
jgi:hypothetical protein